MKGEEKNVNDMEAFVLSFDLSDPTLGLTNELTFSLNYQRQITNHWKAKLNPRLCYMGLSSQMDKLNYDTRS